jgi:predicted aminopeptidase
MSTPRQLGTLAALTAVLALLIACASPGYYAQAIAGHLQLMRQRQDVAEILSAEQTDAVLRSRLELATELRAFAVRELGLPDNGSYSEFVRTGRDAVTWNVVAAPELSLDARNWCFPVAGCVPYRGYFQQEAAQEFAGRLRDDGFDVVVVPVTAYSTLGWFDDPLLDSMLRYQEEQLAAVLFHELAHQQVYVRGDAGFNESYASFVAEAGVTLWLRASGRADRLPEWRDRQDAAARFDSLLLQTRSRLADLYASSASNADKRKAKAALFEQLKAEYRQLVSGPWKGQDLYGNWFANGLNNARLALFASYRGGACAFAALYREAGQDIHRFHARAAEQAALNSEARQSWLEQPCGPVASGRDL